MKLLIVEDNDDIRFLLARSLRQAGYQVVTAACGEEAVEILLMDTFNAVVSDILMPKGNGIWLTEQIRKRGQTMPIILISASGDISRTDALKAGANDFLKKPLDIFALEAILEKVAS